MPETVTPFPTIAAPWPTPTRLPTHEVPLDFSQIVPTLVESYAQSAEHSVQSWNTFTDPVAGVDLLLTFFTVVIIALGIWRVHWLIRGMSGQRRGDAQRAADASNRGSS